MVSSSRGPRSLLSTEIFKNFRVHLYSLISNDVMSQSILTNPFSIVFYLEVTFP